MPKVIKWNRQIIILLLPMEKRGGIQPSVGLKYIGDSRERYVRIIEASTKFQKMKGTPALKLAEVHVQRILLFGITRIQVAFFHRLTIKVY